ncbi:anaphase-promoting complex subunit 4-like [Dreissena polymorpha]|nr:anaphase-promoting complex subunit 4-like [Dreissena polymorpha]
MPELEAFRQVDEKYVSVEAELMEWSPKFDLVALSNIQGEVVLHRLTWQKVWSLPAQNEETKVKAMAWRPDGKVLAVGYSSGQVVLCYIENAEVLHTIEVGSQVTSLSWVCHAAPKCGASTLSDPYLQDNTATYLPKLHPLNKSYGSLSKGKSEDNVEDKKKLQSQKQLNVLVIGSCSQEVQLYIYGVFPVAKVTVGEEISSESVEIVNAVLSEDLTSLLVVLKQSSSGDQEFTLHTFDTHLLTSHDNELKLLAQKYGQIATFIQYLDATVQQMQEAWEDILLEMDSKLYTFAKQKQASGAGTVSNDFLELLLFGVPSPELRTFLLCELTDKGVKKLGHSIGTSYSNIQKLVVKHLQTVSQAILYQLGEMKGMAQCYEKFGVLGVDPDRLHKALMTTGSFVLKTSELQQVIDGSIKNFKAFFKWLYVVILRLSDEKPPAELSEMTQHDVNFVADFLRDNFAQFTEREEEESIEDLRATSPTDKKPGFKLEKVGQYLKKERLSCPPDISNNPWVQFTRASPSLKDSKVLYPVESNKSLLQLQESLEQDTYAMLHKPALTIGKSVQCVSSLYLFSTCPREDHSRHVTPKFSQFTSGSLHLMFTLFLSECQPSDRLHVLFQPTDAHSVDGGVKIVSVRFSSLPRPELLNCSSESNSERSDALRVLDVAYYDEGHMTCLLVEDNADQTPALVKLALGPLVTGPCTQVTATVDVNNCTDIPVVDVCDMEDVQYRWLPNMKAHSFAVSGTRHTATVLFSSRRRVRIFLMDADQDDDDDEDDVDGDITADQSTINQSACSSKNSTQSEMQMLVDGSDLGVEGEDKENSSRRTSNGEQAT